VCHHRSVKQLSIEIHIDGGQLDLFVDDHAAAAPEEEGAERAAGSSAGGQAGNGRSAVVRRMHARA